MRRAPTAASASNTAIPAPARQGGMDLDGTGVSSPLTYEAQRPWKPRKAPPTCPRFASTRGFRCPRSAALLLSAFHARKGRYIQCAGGRAAACGSTSPSRPACATGAGTRGSDTAGPTDKGKAARREQEPDADDRGVGEVEAETRCTQIEEPHLRLPEEIDGREQAVRS